MSFTHIVTTRVQTGAESIGQSETNTADGEDNRDISIADSVTDQLVAIAIDVSELKSLYIQSDQTITLETNSSSSPTDTFSITANSPLAWTVGSNHSNPLTTDVTAIYLTNASGSAATVKIRVLKDSTP